MQIKKTSNSVSLAFVLGIHRGPVNSPHKWPVTRKMFPFDDVILPCHDDIVNFPSSKLYKFLVKSMHPLLCHRSVVDATPFLCSIFHESALTLTRNQWRAIIVFSDYRKSSNNSHPKDGPNKKQSSQVFEHVAFLFELFGPILLTWFKWDWHNVK